MDGVAVGLFLAIFIPLLAVGIVVQVLFLMNLRDLLRNVDERNRMMAPNHVWLNFIPIFQIAWLFVTVIKVRDSVRAEFQTRGWAPRGDFGFGVGIVYAISGVISGISSPFRLASSDSALLGLAGLGGLAGLAGFICWIVYWVKTNELKHMLAQPQASSPQALPQSSEQVGQKYCPQCGADNRPDSRFCRSCGRSMD